MNIQNELTKIEIACANISATVDGTAEAEAAQAQHEVWYDLLKGCMTGDEAKQLKTKLQNALILYTGWQIDTQKRLEADKIRKILAELHL